VATYNAAMDTPDYRSTMALVHRLQSDVVVLQEVATERARQISRGSVARFPYCFAGGELEILSRYPTRHAHHERSASGLNGNVWGSKTFGGQAGSGVVS